jgi:hypothetical protein
VRWHALGRDDLVTAEQIDGECTFSWLLAANEAETVARAGGTSGPAFFFPLFHPRRHIEPWAVWAHHFASSGRVTVLCASLLANGVVLSFCHGLFHSGVTIEWLARGAAMIAGGERRGAEEIGLCSRGIVG